MDTKVFSSYMLMFSYMSPTTIIAVAEDLAVHLQDVSAQQLLSMALGQLEVIVGHDSAFLMVSDSTLPSNNDVVLRYFQKWQPC